MNYKPLINKEELEKLYIGEQKTIKQISEIYGVSVGAVHKYLIEFNIPRRSKGYPKNKYHMSEENKQKLINIKKGSHPSDESKKKISEAKFKGGIGYKKKRSDGYISIYFPEHPKASKDGTVMEHILVIEAVLGRHLKENEIVHHKNEDRSDNRVCNLQLMTTSEHMRYHNLKRIQEKGRVPNSKRIINETTGQVFNSIADGARYLGVHPSALSKAIRSNKPYKNNKWRFL